MNKVQALYAVRNKIAEISSIKTITLNELTSREDAIAIIDVPVPLGQGRLNAERDKNILLQVSIKSKNMGTAIEQSELIADTFDFNRARIEGLETMLYTPPAFGYKDDTGANIYVCMIRINIL